MLEDPITWDRLRRIFGNPQPVMNVSERQFDYNDDELRKLAQMPWDRIEASDLWYYLHDLAYVELQPELFAYLFPVCLMDWHRSLLADQPCAHGDAEFHYALQMESVLGKMLTDQQRQEVFDVFRDSFLCRLDREEVLPVAVSKDHFLAWLWRFNSLGMAVPTIGSIWRPWWAMATRGRTIAALIYSSGFIYESVEENPAIAFPRTLSRNSGPLPIWEHDSYISFRGWLPSNISFLQEVLSFDSLVAIVSQARNSITQSAERKIIVKILTDLVQRQEFIESRIAELPKILTNPDLNEWSE